MKTLPTCALTLALALVAGRAAAELAIETDFKYLKSQHDAVFGT